MAEELTFAIVLEQLERLYTVLPNHAGMKANPQKTARVYFDSLGGLSGESVRASAKIIIEQDVHFPKPARMREVAWEWTRRNRVEIEPAIGDPLWCPRCQTRVRQQLRYQAVVDQQGFVKLTLDRKGVLLHAFKRDLCDCATKSPYVPDPEYDRGGELAMRRDQITWQIGRPGQPENRTWIPASAGKPMTPIGDHIESAFERAAHAAAD